VSPLFSPAFLRLLGVQSAFGFALSVFVLLPKVLASAFGRSASEIGLVMAAYGVASLLAMPLVGRTVERLGNRGALVLANGAMALSAVGFVLVPDVAALAALLRGLQGIAWSLEFAGGLAAVAEMAPPGRLAQAIGVFGSASVAMNAVAPVIAEPLGERFGYRAMFALAVLAALGALVLARRLPALAGSSRELALGDGDRGPAPGGARAPVLVVLAVSGLAFGVMVTFIAPFALSRGMSAVRGFFVSYTLAALAVRALIMRLADGHRRRRVALVAAVAYGAVVMGTGVLGPAHLLLCGAAFGAAHGAAYPTLMALLLSTTAARARARVLSLANGAMNCGLTVVLGLGLVAERFGYPAVFLIAGALMTAAAWLLESRHATPSSDAPKIWHTTEEPRSHG
jgi:MFS family permease